MNCKSRLLLVIICIFIQYHNSKEIATKSRHENKMVSATSQPDIFKKISRISTIRRLFDLKKIRTKRSTVFPTGVKVCPQESLKQIIASHLAYYRLRVCQEAVWEAFRIFMDRIPQTTEYQNWVDACQQESFCVSEIGKNFSSSQEHLDIIQQRVKEKKIPDKKDEMSTKGTLSPVIIEEPFVSTTGFPHSESASLVTSNDTLFNEIINDTNNLLKETEVTNLVPEQPKQQTVEFTVTLNNQAFTAELSDSSSPQYQELATNFQHQMQKVFENLPGFKEIQVLRFRSDSIVVRYAVVFERGSSESKNKIDETPTIASNKVENGNNEEAKEMSYTVIELQQMVAMALHDDRSLPVDLQTLLFSDDPDIPSDHLESDVHSSVTVSTSKMKTALDEVLIEEVPLGNPTTEYEFPASTVTPEEKTINLVNEITAEAPTVPIRSSYSTTFPEEYGISPTSFPHETEVDLQTPSLEEIIRDIDNKVNGGFTVPFDTPFANSKVNQNELEVMLENNLIGTSSDAPSDIWVGFVPSSVDTNNLVIPISTVIPDIEFPLIDGQLDDEEKGRLAVNNFAHNTTSINIFNDQDFTEMSGDLDIQQVDFHTVKDSTSEMFPYMTVETPSGHTLAKTEVYSTSSYTFIMDKVIVTRPSIIGTPPRDGELHVDHPDDSKDNNLPTDKIDVTSHPPDFLTSENIKAVLSKDDTSTTNPFSISTIKTLPAYIDSSLLFSSTTQELESNIVAISPPVPPLGYEETSSTSSTNVIATLGDTTKEVLGTLEMTPEVLQVLEKTTPGVIGVLEETTPELVGVFEYTTPEEVQVIKDTTPAVVAVIEEITPESIVLQETTLELITMFDETIPTTTLTQISLSTEQSSMAGNIQEYDKKSIFTDTTTIASVLESSFPETSAYLSDISATSQSLVHDSDTEMNNAGAVKTNELEGRKGSTSSPETLINNAAAFSSLEHLTTNTEPFADKGKELVVFFSLRVTNMPFSDDLFNKSSPEYKALEQQFLHLLLPYLQSNLTGFRNLEILNFRKGSVIVNSKLKFAKSVPYNVTEAVHCVLEDFCIAAAQLLNLQIDSYSFDIEPADQTNPCKFMACDEFSECSLNPWTKDVACACKPGYISIDELPCQSICEVEPNHCSEGEKCEIEAGKGAVCSCLKGKSWLPSGTHCSKAAVENISLIIVAASTGALFLAIILLKLVGKMYGGYNHKRQSEIKSYSLHSSGKINPAFYHDESLKSPTIPTCSTSACISPSRDTDHRRPHAPQHTQLSVRRLPVPIMQENLKSRQ